MVNNPRVIENSPQFQTNSRGDPGFLSWRVSVTPPGERTRTKFNPRDAHAKSRAPRETFLEEDNLLYMKINWAEAGFWLINSGDREDGQKTRQPVYTALIYLFTS